MKTLHIARRALLLAGLSFAAVIPAADLAGLQPQMQNNIMYISGGVGEDQQAMLAALSREGYTLQLLFAERGSGAFVADVRVMIADKSGRPLLDAVADGPGFFAKLPEGEYRVTAEYKGLKESRTVHAGNRNPAMTLVYWPAEPGSAPQAGERTPPGESAPPARTGQPSPAGPPR